MKFSKCENYFMAIYIQLLKIVNVIIMNISIFSTSSRSYCNSKNLKYFTEIGMYFYKIIQ